MIRNSRFAKVAISAGLIVTSGAAVLGITSFASAKMASNRVAQVQVSGTTAAGSASGRVAASSDQSSKARPNPIATVATALGMSESDLVAQLTAGKSIADIAKAQNVDIDKVITALTDEFKAHLDAEVKSGEHTQAEADAKLAEFKTRVTTMVNTAGLPPMRGGEGGRGGHGAPFATDNLAKVLKLSATELNTQLRSGKSLADIAKAQGVDINDVKDVLASDFKAHLDAEVKSGEHTQAEADAKLTQFKARLDDMVNGVRPAGGPGMGGRGDHGAPFAMDNLAKALKMTVAELGTQLRSGKSLADIAKAQNVEVNSLKAAMIADFKLHLDAEVKSGEHTQAEADAKLAEYTSTLDARFDDMVNGVRPAGGPDMGGRDGMGGHGDRGGRGGRHGHGGPGDGFGPGMDGQDNIDPQAQGASFPA